MLSSLRWWIFGMFYCLHKVLLFLSLKLYCWRKYCARRTCLKSFPTKRMTAAANSAGSLCQSWIQNIWIFTHAHWVCHGLFFGTAAVWTFQMYCLMELQQQPCEFNRRHLLFTEMLHKFPMSLYEYLIGSFSFWHSFAGLILTHGGWLVHFAMFFHTKITSSGYDACNSFLLVFQWPISMNFPFCIVFCC